MKFLLLFLVYFLTRFFALSSLPIFNDESIYLHWGQIMTNVPGQAFYSLFDGKPPLVLWVFGTIQKFPIDPLVAGRLISIIFGTLTIFGILKICQLLKFSQKTQIIAGLLYILSPLTLFFDRLAILDSPISTIFIWIVYLSLKISQSKIINHKQSLLLRNKSSILLGLVQAAGLWIKGTCRIFLFLPFIIPVLTLLADKNKKGASREAVSFFISFALAQILFFPIRLNSLFPIFQKREADFLLPLSGIFSPVVWSSHLLLLILTLTVFITPLVLIFAVFGFYKLFKTDKKTALVLLSFSVIPLVIEISTARFFLSRYFLFTILPIFIFCAYGLEQIKKWKKIAAIFTFILPVTLTLSLTLTPFSTLKTLSQNKHSLLLRNKILAQDLEQYFTGWTSGYGVKEAADFLVQESQKGPIIVLLRADSGNPEDGMFVFLGKNKNIIFAQATQKPKPEELKALSKFPIFFVSRGPQFLGMENSLSELAIFKKPLGEEFVGIYKINFK